MKTFKSLFIYTFTTFFNAGVSFITFSILTHTLSGYDYGIIHLYNAFSIFLFPFISIGVSFILNIDYFKMNNEEFRKNFSNATGIVVITTFIFTILFFFLSGTIQNYLKLNFFFTITFPVVILLTVFSEIISNLIRNRGNHYLFAGFSTGKTIIEIGLIVLLIIGLGMQWQGRLLASLLSLVISGFFILYLIKKWKLFVPSFEKKKILGIFYSGLPFIPERLSIFFIAYADRFFINHYSNTSEVGYYGAGAQIAIIVNLSIMALSNTFYPSMYTKLSEVPADLKSVKKITLTFLGINSLITLLVIALIPLLFDFFIGEEFKAGEKYAKYLTLGLFFWGIYSVFVAFLLNLKKNKLVMFIAIIGTVVSIVLNFINVRYFGAVGAAYTSVIVYIIMAVLCVYGVHRYYDLFLLFGLRKLVRE